MNTIELLDIWKKFVKAYLRLEVVAISELAKSCWKLRKINKLANEKERKELLKDAISTFITKGAGASDKAFDLINEITKDLYGYEGTTNEYLAEFLDNLDVKDLPKA